MTKRHKLIRVEVETDELLNMCVKEFLDSNPEFRGMKITKNFIVRRIADYYLD